ncbi:hypothetical protein FKM82_023582 [Ascaphus truei]
MNNPSVDSPHTGGLVLHRQNMERVPSQEEAVDSAPLDGLLETRHLMGPEGDVLGSSSHFATSRHPEGDEGLCGDQHLDSVLAGTTAPSFGLGGSVTGRRFPIDPTSLFGRPQVPVESGPGHSPAAQTHGSSPRVGPPKLGFQQHGVLPTSVRKGVLFVEIVPKPPAQELPP